MDDPTLLGYTDPYFEAPPAPDDYQFGPTPTVDANDSAWYQDPALKQAISTGSVALVPSLTAFISGLLTGGKGSASSPATSTGPMNPAVATASKAKPGAVQGLAAMLGLPQTPLFILGLTVIIGGLVIWGGYKLVKLILRKK